MKIPDWVKGAILTAILVWSVPLVYFAFSYFVTMKIARKNFSEAQNRANVARAQSDLRTYQTALENYYVDARTYPPTDQQPFLTTPVGYLRQILPDVFSNSNEPYYYYHYNQNWLVVSRGPNGIIDLQYTDFQERAADQLRLMHYDPTNGAKSAGDLFRIKGPSR